MKITFLTVICTIALVEFSTQTCPFEAFPGNPGKFQTKTSPHISLDCPLASATTTLVFDEVACQCVYSIGPAPTVAPPPSCNDDSVLTLKFDDNLQDSSCNKLYVGSALSPLFDGLHGRNPPSLKLRQADQLHVPFFNGRYENKNMSFSLSVFIRPNIDGFLIDNIINYNCPGGGHSKIRLDYVATTINDGNVRGQLQSNLGVSQIVHSNNILPAFNFTHIAMTFDQVCLKLYVDGVLEVDAPLFGGVGNAACPLIIHQNSEGEGKINIDNLQIFDRELSQADINHLKEQNL
jgi:hypothetical protein